MGNWDEKAKEVFYLFTHTLLSLLLPLSFLLLAKLSTVQYYLQRLSWHQYNYYSQPFPYVLSLALSINPYILYVLVFIISLTSLIHSLTNKVTILRNSSTSTTVLAWILLCVFQVCVGLGIEGSIMVGFYDDDGPSFVVVERSFLSKVAFLLGLHETTRVWCGMVVRPVVDDTVFGVVRKERWIEKVAVAMSLGILWWWRLRDEVESLVVMVEVKKEQLMDVGINDFVGCWLYYLIVVVGIVRVVKGLIWIIRLIFPCRTKPIEIYKMEPSENVDNV